jgi:hypothetical protein
MQHSGESALDLIKWARNKHGLRMILHVLSVASSHHGEKKGQDTDLSTDKGAKWRL